MRYLPGCLQTLTARYDSVRLCNMLTELSHMKYFEKLSKRGLLKVCIFCATAEMYNFLNVLRKGETSACVH